MCFYIYILHTNLTFRVYWEFFPMGPDSTLITTRLRYWEGLHLSSKCFLVIRSRLLFWPLWMKKLKWCYKSLITAAHVMYYHNHNTTAMPGNKRTYHGTQATLIFELLLLFVSNCSIRHRGDYYSQWRVQC